MPGLEAIAWVGITCLVITWQRSKIGLLVGALNVIPWTTPVRAGTPQSLNYTFTDQNQNPINLAGYTISLLLQLQGQAAPVTLGAQIVSSVAGTVTCPYTFATPGIWQAQFLAQNQNGPPVYGEPVQVRVVSNVDTAAGNLLNF
jgi:hypothetical protein